MKYKLISPHSECPFNSSNILHFRLHFLHFVAHVTALAAANEGHEDPDADEGDEGPVERHGRTVGVRGCVGFFTGHIGICT